MREFQFHKGSINTLRVAAETKREDGSFNSIKVRLIPRRNPPNHPRNMFQFHKGSINTQRSLQRRET